MIVWLLSCGADDDAAPAAPAFCDDGPALIHDPDPSAYFTTWPDDFWRIDGADTPTGHRLALGIDEYPGAAEFPENFRENFDYAATLDGFGTTTPVVFQFTAPVTDRVTTANAAIAAKIGGAWVDQPIDVTFEDAGLTVFLTPRLPLPDASEVVGVVWNLAGEPCVQPSEALRDALVSGDAALDARRREAVSGLTREISEVGALTVFTTQSAAYTSIAAAAVIEERTYAAGPATCAPDETGRTVCDLVVPVDDFRDAEHLVPGWEPEILGSYDLPVRVWLPAGAGPFPVVLCGHGLGGDKGDCSVAADVAGPEGWAVVAVDAVEHGEHPGQTEADLSLLEPLKIFAIRAIPPGIHGLRLRDNFRQSAWDKLQVIRALQAGFDLTGDGLADLDAEHLVYLGASLGGIMAAEPSALTDAIDANVLFVGGGRLTQIIQDSPSFAPLVELMAPPELSDGEVARAFPLLQSLVDGGDAMTFAARVHADRPSGGEPPHTVLMLAKDDDVVPNSTNANLARALGATGLGREVWPIDGIAFEPGPLTGDPAVAVLQFDEVTVAGSVVPAAHDNVHLSDEAAVLIREILASVLEGRSPVLEAP